MKNSKQRVLAASMSALTMVSSLSPMVALAYEDATNGNVAVVSSVEDITTKIESLKQELEVKKAELDKVKAEYDSVNVVTQEKQGVYDEAKAEALQAEIEANEKITTYLESLLAEIEKNQTLINEYTQARETAEAKVQELQVALETAKQNVADKEASLETAKNEASIATPEEITKAEAEIVTAEEELAKAKTALETAEGELATAQKELETAEANRAVAQGTADSLLAKVNSLVVAQEAAQKEYNNALLVYEGAKDPVKRQEAVQALEDAKNDLTVVETAFNEATLAVENAKDDVTTAEGDVETSKGVLAEKETAQATAQGVYDTAKGELDSANTDLANATTAKDTLVSEKAVLDGIVSDKTTFYESKKQVAEIFGSELPGLTQNIDTTKTAMEEAKTFMEEAQALYAKGSKGFFESVGATQAVEYVDPAVKDAFQEEVYKYTSLGAVGDATNLDNMADTIQYLQYYNNLRKSLGLSELKVTNEMMAAAQIQLNVSTVFEGHSNIFKVDENLAYISSGKNPFDYWYDMEKAIYDEACVQDPSIKGMAPIELQQYNPTLFNQVGHYLAIVKDDYAYTGFAINTSDGYGSANFNQVFATTSANFIQGTSYTVDEYAALFNNYYNEIKNAEEEYNNSVIAYNLAVRTLNDATAQYNTAVEEMNTAEGEINVAIANADAKAIEITNAEKVVSEKQGVVDAKTITFTSAETELNVTKGEVLNAQADVEAKETVLGNARTTLAEKEEALVKATETLNNAKALVEEKQGIVDKINEGIASAEASLLLAEGALNTANQNLANAQTEYNTAVIDLNVKIAKVTDAEGVVEAKGTLVESANADYEVKNNTHIDKVAYLGRLNKLLANLDEAQVLFDTAVAERDGLVESITKAEEEVTVADNQLGVYQAEVTILTATRDDYSNNVKVLFDAVKGGAEFSLDGIDESNPYYSDYSLIARMGARFGVQREALAELEKALEDEKPYKEAYETALADYNSVEAEIDELQGDLFTDLLPSTPVVDEGVTDDGNTDTGSDNGIVDNDNGSEEGTGSDTVADKNEGTADGGNTLVEDTENVATSDEVNGDIEKVDTTVVANPDTADKTSVIASLVALVASGLMAGTLLRKRKGSKDKEVVSK